MTKENKIISLGVLANKLKLPKSKLSYYDLIGLIKPIDVTVGGMRIYDADETTKRIKKIMKLQEEGLSLKKIAEDFKEE